MRDGRRRKSYSATEFPDRLFPLVSRTPVRGRSARKIEFPRFRVDNCRLLSTNILRGTPDSSCNRTVDFRNFKILRATEAWKANIKKKKIHLIIKNAYVRDTRKSHLNWTVLFFDFNCRGIIEWKRFERGNKLFRIVFRILLSVRPSG